MSSSIEPEFLGEMKPWTVGEEQVEAGDQVLEACVDSRRPVPSAVT